MYVCTYTYICIYIRKNLYMYMYIYTYTHMYMHIFTYTHIHMYVYVYTHVYTYVYVYIYIYTCIYIDRYIHAYVPSQVCTSSCKIIFPQKICTPFTQKTQKPGTSAHIPAHKRVHTHATAGITNGKVFLYIHCILQRQ